MWVEVHGGGRLQGTGTAAGDAVTVAADPWFGYYDVAVDFGGFRYEERQVATVVETDGMDLLVNGEPFIVKGVNIFPMQIERVLLSMPQVGAGYVIVIDREGYSERLTVKVELTADAFLGDIKQLQSLRDRISETLRREILVRPRVELVEPGTLPRTEGKAVRVIDQRDE